MAFLVALHFWRVRKDGGLSAPPGRLHRPRPPPGRHLVFRELLVLILVLVWFTRRPPLDAPLEEIADATRTPTRQRRLVLPRPAGARPLRRDLRGSVVPTALVLALLVLPYVDTHPRGVGVWFAPERRFRTPSSPWSPSPRWR